MDKTEKQDIPDSFRNRPKLIIITRMFPPPHRNIEQKILYPFDMPVKKIMLHTETRCATNN
jgi:hypothetical protein